MIEMTNVTGTRTTNETVNGSVNADQDGIRRVNPIGGSSIRGIVDEKETKT